MLYLQTGRIARIILLITVVISLTACNLNRPGAMDTVPDTTGDRRMQTDHVTPLVNNRTGNQGVIPRQNQGIAGNVNLHRNTRVEMSQEMADKIASMDEIDRANVFLTDQNAYVAVVLERNVEQQYDKQTNQRGARAQGTRGRGTQGGAGVGGMFTQTDEVTDRIKDKIANQVQSVYPSINNVFVSANPDFMDRLNNFVNQTQDGRPIRGFINEFNTLVERIFPTNEGPNPGIMGTGNTTRNIR